MRSTLLALVLAALALVAACSDDDATISDPTTLLPDLQIETTLLTPEVVRGEDMQARLTLSNNTDQVLTLHFSDGCQTSCEVLDAFGHSMAPGRSCVQVPTRIDIEPRSSVDVTASFSTCAMEIVGYPYDIDPIPAGDYTFRPYLVGLNHLAESLTVTVTAR